MRYHLPKTLGWLTFGKYLTGKTRNEASPTNQCWCQKTRVIAALCGIKISTVHHLVLSQYMHLTDRQTDRQKCDSNTVRCITCSRTVKIILQLLTIHFMHNQILSWSLRYRSALNTNHNHSQSTCFNITMAKQKQTCGVMMICIARFMQFWKITQRKNISKRCDLRNTQMSSYRVIICRPAMPDLISNRPSNVDHIFFHLDIGNMTELLQFYTSVTHCC